MQPKQAIAFMAAAFRRENLDDMTIAVYLDRIADIPPDLMDATVKRLVNSSRFMPSVAEIRETAAGIAGLLPASPAEALEIIRRADVEESIFRRDGSFAYTEHSWKWPQDAHPATMKAVFEALRKVGDPVNFREEKRKFGWETGFQKTYEVIAEETKAIALADLSKAALPSAERKQLT